MSSARCAITFWSVSSATIWAIAPVAEMPFTSCDAGVPTSTAITRVAPSAWATSIGKLRATMPSTSVRPSITTGVNAPGIDIEARIDSARSPPSITTISPVDFISGPSLGSVPGKRWNGTTASFTEV